MLIGMKMEKQLMSSIELNRALELAIKKKYPERNFWRDRIALELAISRLKAQPLDEIRLLGLTYDSQEEDATTLSSLDAIWNWVDTLLDVADDAVFVHPEDGKEVERWTPQSRLSLHKNYDQNQGASLERLSQCATSYLKGNWAVSPTLERWLVQQMIYAEAKAFAAEVDVLKKERGAAFYWARIKTIGTWVVGLIVALGIADDHGEGVGFLSFAVWLAAIRYLSQDSVAANILVAKAFDAMESAYRFATRTNACPVEVENALTLGESKHVVWPEGLRGLVNRAVSRNGASWQ
jgi:hypothetical protein